MGHVTAVINQKGGVGKTTTAVSLAAWMAHLGRRVLLVDIDPQGNATSGLGIDRRDLPYCVYDALIGRRSLAEVTVATRWERLRVAPSTLNLAGLEVELAAATQDAGWRERRLREVLDSGRETFDIALIDGPPSLGLLTVNALAASDGVVIPVQTEYYALEGLSQLLNTLQFVQRRLNPALDLDGVALTMHDHRTNLARQVAAEVRAFFGRRAFESIVPRNVKLGEAPSFGEPITTYAPDSPGSVAYREMARELLHRVGLGAAWAGEAN
ncbi:MAG: ParA family protein [Fimbriimonadaceae bacterium]|nr:ParA family protein [Fimbriimonadaceae bacterium]